jgi:hypothetical protein
VIDLENSENVKQMKFKDLIGFLKEEAFGSCFSLILYQLSEVMYLLHQMLECCQAQNALLGQQGAYYADLYDGTSKLVF